MRRYRAPSLVTLFLGATVCLGCDAYLHVVGHMAAPPEPPVTQAIVEVRGSGRTVDVATDGSFDVSTVHGGRCVLRFSAPGYRAVEKEFRGTTACSCVVVLVEEAAPRSSRSTATCECR